MPKMARNTNIKYAYKEWPNMANETHTHTQTNTDTQIHP